MVGREETPSLAAKNCTKESWKNISCSERNHDPCRFRESIGLCSEICQASSHNAHQAVSRKAEELSGAAEEMMERREAERKADHEK
jgi:hypothetical protein